MSILHNIFCLKSNYFLGGCNNIDWPMCEPSDRCCCCSICSILAPSCGVFITGPTGTPPVGNGASAGKRTRPSCGGGRGRGGSWPAAIAGTTCWFDLGIGSIFQTDDIKLFIMPPMPDIKPCSCCCGWFVPLLAPPKFPKNGICICGAGAGKALQRTTHTINNKQIFILNLSWATRSVLNDSEVANAPFILGALVEPNILALYSKAISIVESLCVHEMKLCIYSLHVNQLSK